MYHGRFGFRHAGNTQICATNMVLIAMFAKLRKREGETSPSPPSRPCRDLLRKSSADDAAPAGGIRPQGINAWFTKGADFNLGQSNLNPKSRN